MSLLSERQMNIVQDEIQNQLPQYGIVNRDGHIFDLRGRKLGRVSVVTDNKIIYRIGEQSETIELSNWPIDRSCE